MKLGFKTAWAVLLGAGLLLEAVAVLNPNKGDTLSELVWSGIDATPLLPFALGLVAGHFVWPRTIEKADIK